MSPVGTVSSFNVKYLLKPFNMRQFSTQIAQNLPVTDRNETVEIVSNFYIFLTTHGFLPASAIKTHSEGWPGENCGAFRKMGKSDEVVDLLSYLPYIDYRTWEWLHDTNLINYISLLNLRRRK